MTGQMNAQHQTGARAPPRKMESTDYGVGFAEYMSELGTAAIDLLADPMGKYDNDKSKIIFGYRIISINKGSPVDMAQSKERIQPYEDVIVGLNGELLDAEQCRPNRGPLHNTVKQFEDKELTLTVFNCNSRHTR